MKIEKAPNKHLLVKDVEVGTVFTAGGLMAGGNTTFLMTHAGLVCLEDPTLTWERDNRAMLSDVIIYPNAKVVLGAAKQ